MPNEPNEPRAKAVDELRTALRAAHVRAGEPSSRSIAQGIGGISHTTVNQALRGTTIPSWPILSKIAVQLGGDEDEFRELWAATRDSGSRLDDLPAPAPSGSDISVFVSYAHVDDEATFNRISKFVRTVRSLYESMTGEQVQVFMDVESIDAGEVWLDRIRLGISSSSVLLAFISPAYLRSAYCIEEYREFSSFVSANTSTRLIVPLMFAERDRIDKYFSGNANWSEMQKLQPVDLSGLRYEEPGSPGWLKNGQRVVDRIEDVLTDVNTTTTQIEQRDHSRREGLVSEPPSRHFLEALAQVEDSGSETAEHLNGFGKLLERIGAEAQKVTPMMQRASTAKRRLQLARQLARALTPISSELANESAAIANGMMDWDAAITAVLERISSDPSQLDDDDVSAFLVTIGDMARSGEDSFASLDGFLSSLAGAKGFARELDVPIKVIEDAVRQMAGIRGTLNGWSRGLDLLRLRHDA